MPIAAAWYDRTEFWTPTRGFAGVILGSIISIAFQVWVYGQNQKVKRQDEHLQLVYEVQEALYHSIEQIQNWGLKSLTDDAAPEDEIATRLAANRFLVLYQRMGKERDDDHATTYSPAMAKASNALSKGQRTEYHEQLATALGAFRKINDQLMGLVNRTSAHVS